MISDKTDQNILVSIALATHNGESFLDKQIDSLLKQSYRNIEIVISDDKSSDNTANIIEKYQHLDDRILFSVNPNPQGFKKNFERAILSCRGEIIFLCDQDDIWYPTKIEEHMKIYKNNPDVTWIYNEFQITDSEGKVINKMTDINPNYYLPLNLYRMSNGNCKLGCATSYRKNILSKALPTNDLAPGHDSWIQLAIYPAKHDYIDKILQDYRQHDKNIFGIYSKKSVDPAKERENNINKNIAYLKSLCLDQRFTFGKRTYLATILALKLLRHKII